MTTNPAFNLIGLNDLRNDPRYRNIDGQVDEGPQLAVAVLDTGLYGAHPEIDDNFLGFLDFTNNNDGSAVQPEDAVVITDPNSSVDVDTHGTHVAGTIAAENDAIGVAPRARLLGLEVLGGAGFENAILNGLQWVKDNRQGTINGQDYRIVSVNMSLGFYGKLTSIDDLTPLEGIFTSPEELNNRSANSPEVRSALLTRELEQAGIPVVSATGNDYANHADLRNAGITMPTTGQEIPVQNVATPAIGSSIAAGSIDAQGGAISSFSQRLNFSNMLHAPGGDILSTVVPGSAADGDGSGLGVLSGTSMASPHIAGAIALMQDAALTYGGRTLSSEEVQQILLETAFVINDGDDENYRTPVVPTGENYLSLNIYGAIQEIDRRFGGTTQPNPEPEPDPNPEPEPEPDPTGNDLNGTINTAISLESDVGVTLESLTEFTIVGSEVIGADFNAEGEVDSGDADVDLISFNVPESGGLVAIETSAAEGGEPVDTVLRLFDSAGNEVAVDDDGASDGFSRVEALVDSGTYYVGVTGFGNSNYNPNVANSGTAGATGSYGLGFQFQAGAGDSTEGGDQNGTIATAGTADFLVFDEIETQVAAATIGSDPIPDVSERVSVGRSDIDIISFDVTTPGVMVIETSDGNPDDSENLDSVLRLFDGEGNELAADDDGGDDLFSRIEASVQPGTYYLGVSGYDNLNYDPNTLDGRNDGSTGLVDVTFDFQTSDNTDPNGIRSGAVEVALRPGEVTEIVGEIGTDFTDIQVNEEDVDLLTFTATQDATLLLDIDTPFGTEFGNSTDELTFADTYLRFFDSEGVEIASSDDDFAADITGEIVESDTNSEEGSFYDPAQDQSGNLIGHDVDSFLRVNVEEGQTYYVGVSAFGNATYNLNNLDERSSLNTGGFYQLLMTNITTSDRDGSISQAPTLSENTINGNIGFDEEEDIGATDVDMYEFTPSQRGLLQLDIDSFSTLPAEQAVDSVLFLYDAQGNELAFNDDETSGSYDARLEYLVDSGQTYYISVTGYGNDDLNPSFAGSGAGGDTGDYTLNINLLEPQTGDGGSDAPDNSFAAAFADFFAGDSFSSQVDIDRNIVGSAFSSLDTSSVNSLTLGTTVTSFLGEDPQGSENIFSSFSDLYSNQASLVFGSSQSGNITSGGLPEDADYYLLPIEEAGRYDLRTLVATTELGASGTQTNLRLYNSAQELVEVESSSVNTSGVNSRLTVNIEQPGDYWLVVLPDGSASDNFDFASHSFGDITSEQRQEFSNNLGEYALAADRFVLQADNQPFFYNGALNLQLNDRIAAEEIDNSSVIVTDSSGNTVDGSVVVGDNGQVTFVPTNPLIDGEYNVTYTSDDFMTQDASFAAQRNLDGDGDGTPGGDLTSSFTVASEGVSVSVPGFGRDPGQAVDVNGTGLPISVSNGEGLQDIRLRVDYDADLLNISDATLASSLPEDWSISQVDISGDRVIIDLTGTTPLTGDTTELVRLTATVPEDAPSGGEQVLQVSGGAIDRNNNSVIFNETAAVQNLSFNEDDPVIDLLDTNINRFQNEAIPGTYLFARDEESETIRADFPNFVEEGVAFQVADEQGEDLIPIIRFQSKVTPGTYLFATESESASIRENFSESFDEEGLAFYVYGVGSDRGTEFIRFQNSERPGTYLFASPGESETIRANFPNFEEEGPAFRVGG